MFCRSQTKINGSGSSFQDPKSPENDSYLGKQACTRINWLFCRCLWPPSQKWPNTQEDGCNGHIKKRNSFPDQERGMNVPASLLHSWHWVLSSSRSSTSGWSLCARLSRCSSATRSTFSQTSLRPDLQGENWKYWEKNKNPDLWKNMQIQTCTTTTENLKSWKIKRMSF